MRKKWKNWKTEWTRQARAIIVSAMSVALLFTTMTPGTEIIGNAVAAPAKSVVAYVYGDADYRDEDGQHLTQMNYAFALVNEDGEVTLEKNNALTNFLKYTKKHGLKAVLAIGGWGADGFSQAASTLEGRRTFAQSAAALVKQYGFDGVDIDWEYPGSGVAGIAYDTKDKENFTLLLSAMRAALDEIAQEDGRYRLLSIAVGGADYVNHIECAFVSALVDQVNLMTYDMTGFSKTTGHHTPLYGADSADEAVKAYLNAGIPANKLLLGAATYGKAWRQVNSQENNGLGQTAQTSGNKTYNYSTFANMMQDTKAFFDDNAQAAWLFDGSTFISYDSEKSVAAKAAYVREKDLGGIMYWAYGKDGGVLLQQMAENVH